MNRNQILFDVCEVGQGGCMKPEGFKLKFYCLFDCFLLFMFRDQSQWMDQSDFVVGAQL